MTTTPYPQIHAIQTDIGSAEDGLFYAVVVAGGESPRVFRTGRSLRLMEDWCYLSGYTLLAYGAVDAMWVNPEWTIEWLPLPAGEDPTSWLN
ncbi:MAG: hypothetical protein M1318_02280 [Firmicutes bacterium]|nr:hypothetical protein [Bacillota bacterium]